MSILYLQEKLARECRRKLKLKINDNRSTMLSVKWEPDCTKVSLHKMFLEAPQNIMQELACYISRENKDLTPLIKAYIEDNLQKLDYSHTLDTGKLSTVGQVYDLKKYYDEVNKKYFNSEMDLRITWYGRRNHKNKSKVTFGLYHDPLKLIKINRLLDNPTFPDYLLSYVIYHEMLHNACPAYVDENGKKRIHSKEFKEREEQFAYYKQAKKWIKDHPAKLFAQY